MQRFSLRLGASERVAGLATVLVARVHRDPEWAGLARVLALVVCLRWLVMPAVAFLVNAAFPLDRPASFSVFAKPHIFWDTFARYDSGWYYSVARDGYRYADDQPSNLAFFPLYPMAMRYVGWLLGGEQHHYYVGGMLVSHLAFLAALILLYHLARMDLDAEAARRAVLYAAVFPFGFFYSRVYAESLYLLVTLAAFYGFRTRRWELGGVAGGLASLTRKRHPRAAGPGMDRGSPLSGRAGTKASRRPGAGGGGSRVGDLLCLFVPARGLALRVGDAIRRWNYEPAGVAPWAPLIALLRQLVRRPYEFVAVEPNGPYDTLNGVTAMVFVAAIPFVWRRLGAAYGLFMLVNLWMPLSSGQFEGLGRYCAVLFPFFIWLASFESILLRDLVLLTSIALYVLCLSLFVTLHPIF